MSDCWKCEEVIDGYGNYCGQCGAPQKPRMAAHSFNRSASNFRSGLNGILDLIDGCPEMLADGLAEMDGYDLSASEWERRFENSFRWLEGYFLRLWAGHYDISRSELEELFDDHEGEDSGPDSASLPAAENDTCACGTSLPSDSPSIITCWQEATVATAVCFECFGQVQSRIAVSN